MIIPIDITMEHAGAHRKGPRPWASVTGITLHQTACLLGEDMRPWSNVPVQMGVTRDGKIYLINPIEEMIWHGHSLSTNTVGIEIDGWYEGIEGDYKTLWQPPTGSKRRPMTLSLGQIEAARDTVEYIVETVAAAGGEIKSIHAHRQASNQRQSDPGSAIWREVGMWAMREHGLTDGGMGWKTGPTGMPIPEAWNKAYVGIPY